MTFTPSTILNRHYLYVFVCKLAILEDWIINQPKLKINLIVSYNNVSSFIYILILLNPNIIRKVSSSINENAQMKCLNKQIVIINVVFIVNLRFSIRFANNMYSMFFLHRQYFCMCVCRVQQYVCVVSYQGKQGLHFFLSNVPLSKTFSLKKLCISAAQWPKIQAYSCCRQLPCCATCLHASLLPSVRAQLKKTDPHLQTWSNGESRTDVQRGVSVGAGLQFSGLQ